MTWIYSVILCLFFKARICQLQRVEETRNDTEFSINVTSHMKTESGKCISIPFQLTFPTNKVTVPFMMILLDGDRQSSETAELGYNSESEMKYTLMLNGLPRGEYEYGFKLQWGGNQTYIFPKRVWISVSALTERPAFTVPTLTEGGSTLLTCHAEILCFKRLNLHCKWTRADGQTSGLQKYSSNMRYSVKPRIEDTIYVGLTPTADYHNTNITCVADYGYEVVETTVTLAVKFSPRILNAQCMVKGKLVVCMCISRGNPLPSITWPSASLTDFSVSSCSSSHTVNSTITMATARYLTRCVISNELDRIEIGIPLQNSTTNSRQNYSLVERHTSDATLPWIISGVAFSLNLVLLTGLIYTYKRGKRTRQTGPEEMNIYASLNMADVEREYSVISPQTR